MVEPILIKNKVITWVCNECNTEYASIPAQCKKCGSMPQSFDEKFVNFIEGERGIFLVRKNIVIGQQEYKQGKQISLVLEDPIVKDLLSRNLVVRVDTGVKVEKIEETKVEV